MNLELLEEYFKYIVTYLIPIASLVVSVISLIKSSKVPKLEKRIQECDLLIKQYQLEKIEKERKSNAVVEARIIRISDNNYKIRVFNIGNISAFQVDYDIPAKYNIVLCKQVTPFEELKPGASFDEHVLIHMGSEPKYEVITEWDDENGEHYTRKDIRTY